jgi:two-component system chemotaxis sensor kinase CheA
MNKYKILCVDDEQETLDINEFYLKNHYTVLKAHSTDEALELLQVHQNEIIFVFSDFMMPKKDGLQLRKEMQQLGIDIPFAVITGNYNIEMATKAMELQVCSFVEKPCNAESLFELIANYGEKRISQLKEEEEMVCSFISESTPMLEEIEGLILVLEEQPNDLNALNTYFRLLHTIKGTASCVGLKSLPKFTHVYEDLVSLAKEQKISITPAVVDSLLYGLDRLKYMYKEIIQNKNFEFNVDEWIEKINTFQDKKIETKNENELIITEGSQESPEHKKGPSEKLPIPLETLDSFLELSGKLTILRNTIYKATARVEIKHTNDKDVEILSSSIEELHKITSVLQKQISEMRKIAAENITRPLKRVVRDTSRDLQKEIDLIIHNETIKIDNTIAKIISNSLVHLIRNSIDHGIETPETRKKLNKTIHGKINLSFSEEGDNIIVDLNDDGSGISKKRVLDKAIEKKIITEKQAANLSHNEILELIFASGFSTSQNVTSISGRGVGMDMVKSSVESIDGKIHIESTEGVGTKFKLVLPQPKSVLINKTLMIEENNECFSVPIDDILEVVKVTSDNFHDSIFTVANFPVLKRYEEIIPIFKLENCLVQNPSGRLDLNLRDEIIAIIIKNGMNKIGLIVDKVHDIEESVVRKIKPVLNTSPIYSGVTYFGDDDLALVLNIDNIIKENLKTLNQIRKETHISSEVVSATNSEHKNEYFTFQLDSNIYGIDKDKVFRIEIFESHNIQNFYGNFFINYRENIIKIISLDNEKIKKIKDQEFAKVLLIKNLNTFYALYVDDFFEFIISYYHIENLFSKNTITKGSIIYNEQIIYIVDEINLDKSSAGTIPEQLSEKAHLTNELKAVA